MNHLFRKISFSLLIILFLFSCREKVEMEFPHFAPMPVLNGILTPGNPVVVHVSLAGKLDTVPLQTVRNALVELYVNDQLATMMTHEENGMYSSSVIATTETLYTCRVKIPGYETATATTFIPAPSEIHKLEHINYAGKDKEGYTFPAFKLTFSNDPGQDRYYEIRLVLFDRDQEREITLLTDKITDPVLLNEGLPLMLFSNQIITTPQYGMQINYFTQHTESPSPSISRVKLFPMTVELRSVSSEYYLFTRSVYQYKKSRFPDYDLNAYHAFPLYSNVDNGYGLFTGYSSDFSEKIHPSY